MRTRMYERDAALAAVRRLLDAAYTGHGGMVFVVAAAGLGKTSVLDAAVQEAWTRFDVRIGRADAVEATLPYGLVGQALGEDAEPADGEPAGDLPAASRYYATLRRVRRQAADRPLLLAFDDLHWSDPDSLALVHLLCRRAPELPVAVVATARPWPDAALRMAEQLAAHALADIQRLPPLSDRAARAVLRDRFGELGREAVERAVSACDGNPLLLELAAPNPHAKAADAGAAPGEPTRRLLLARFSAADPATQAYVRAASVLGVQFRPAIAAALAELPAERAVGIVENLVRADLLREDDQGGLRFRHALLRQAVYDDLPAPTRAYLHQRAFRTLLTAGVAAGEAAEHAVAADLVGDRQAIATLGDAGRAALHAGAVRAAGRHLRAAVRLAGDDATADLRIDLARALLADGASQDAAAVLDRLLTTPELPEQTRLQAQLLRGQAAFNTGATRQAGGLFDAVARTAGTDHPDVAVRALLAHALQSWARLGPRAALPVASRARQLTSDSEPYLRACADAAWALCAWLTGDPAALPVAEAVADAVPRRRRPPTSRTGASTRRPYPPTSPSGPSVSRSPNGCSPTRCTRPNNTASHSCCSTPHCRMRTCSAGWAGWRRRRPWPSGPATPPSCCRSASRWPGRRRDWPWPSAGGWPRPPGTSTRPTTPAGTCRPATSSGCAGCSRTARRGPTRPAPPSTGWRSRPTGAAWSTRRRSRGRPTPSTRTSPPIVSTTPGAWSTGWSAAGCPAGGPGQPRPPGAARWPSIAGTSTSRRPASPRRYACCGTSRCHWPSAGPSPPTERC